MFDRYFVNSIKIVTGGSRSDGGQYYIIPNIRENTYSTGRKTAHMHTQ